MKQMSVSMLYEDGVVRKLTSGVGIRSEGPND